LNATNALQIGLGEKLLPLFVRSKSLLEKHTRETKMNGSIPPRIRS
jgi:hypothetical protein